MRGTTRQRSHDLPDSDSAKARLFLAVACIWPLCLMALFAASAPHVDVSESGDNAGRGLGLKFRELLDRADVMGYGPTHPRIGVVLVGDDKDNLLVSLSNVLENTDLNRIFVITVVFEGTSADADFEAQVQKLDEGGTTHWHGGTSHSHNEKHDNHDQKIHVIFSEERGLASSRQDGVDFITILEKQHEAEGLKSPEEDLILVLMQSGAQLTSRQWLPTVTEALIVPPPILGKHDQDTVALKVANAVALNLEGNGKSTSFDRSFTSVISQPSPDQLNESSGESYPTPAWNGAAIAMRLDTYRNLPLQDLSLKNPWAVNLDLSLNLWLCADGIDMIRDLSVTTFEHAPSTTLSPNMAARFAAAWMDDATSHKFYNSYRTMNPELTYLEWELQMARARASPHFARNLFQKCRSFKWYIETINSDLLPVLEFSEKVDHSGSVSLPAQKAALDEGDKDDDGPDLTKPIHEEKAKPSKPLCKLCLEVAQQAKPVDISYVDVSGGHKEHPHMGAKDADGNYGYIHDETKLHNHPDTFDVPEDSLRTQCSKRDNNYRMLNEQVFVDFDYDKKMIESGKPRVKIFCLVYTTSAGHGSIPNIRKTWAPKCDGFMVASNLTDTELGTVHIPHRGEESYYNIWQKVRSMWSYVYDNYYETYDWFHIGGDDLYVLVENLRMYLESEEIRTASNGGVYLPTGDEKEQTPLFLGRRFAYQGDMNDIFNSGGSGYTMNKAALKRLVVDGFPNIFPNAHTFSEDTMIAKILRRFGVFPYETKDENGGERYMPFMPGHHYGYRMPKDTTKDWYARYSINVKEGREHCAKRSIAFHYVKGNAMTRLHALLYKLCPKDTM